MGLCHSKCKIKGQKRKRALIYWTYVKRTCRITVTT